MSLTKKTVFFRKSLDKATQLISICAALTGIIFLVWILFEVISKGFEAFSVDFFMLPTLDQEEGGVANAILGTVIITVVSTVIGVPLGLLGGVFLSEYGRQGRIGDLIRFSANVMMGMPSIILGLFVYTLLVQTTGNFSGLAGAISLAIIMLPVVLRTTEDMLCMVPNALRESALALGTPKWKVTIQILFRSARTGLITGILLAIARVSGETAPLLFTSMNSYYWPLDPWWNVSSFFTSPTANLTVTIYNYAMSPYAQLNKMAWGASLLITFAVLSINVLARYLLKEKK